MVDWTKDRNDGGFEGCLSLDGNEHTEDGTDASGGDDEWWLGRTVVLNLAMLVW